MGTPSTVSHSVLQFCLALLIVILHVGVNEAYKDGLYSTEADDVLPLNNTALMKRVIKNEEKIVWAVEFYNSWCGHCIHFAPTWKKLASSLKGWRDLVRIAAVDCSQSINLAACRKFDINKYPTMKLFSPLQEKESKISQVMRPLDSQELDKIIHKIINFMSEFAPRSWPRLMPLEKIEDIWQEKTDKHEYVALIFEEAESITGRKVVLDMRNTPNVLVRTMLDESVAKFGLSKFPSLYQINPDSTYSLMAIGTKVDTQDHQLFVNMLKTLSKGQGHKLSVAKNKKDFVLRVNQEPASTGNRGNAMSASSLNNSLRVSMQDLESALHYTFRQEIAICKSIGGFKFNALEKFVQALLKYFPGREPIMKFLEAVSQMLSQVTSSNLSGEEWITKIDSLQNSEAFLPEVIEWDCCRGSQPRYRGYPCAMWTMFHVMTVGAYSQQRFNGRGSNPLEVVLAIRGYMEHFFGCEECSKHFLKMASTMEQEIKDAQGAVLWLWRSHNKANLRLSGDESEDRAFPKVQFPPRSLCPRCQPEKGNATAPVWNMEAVFKFLLSFYIGKNIYFSPELSKREYSSEGRVHIAQSKLTSESHRNELDWWETKQREQDLKMVRQLRNRKRNSQSGQKLGPDMINSDGGVVERLADPHGKRDEEMDFKITKIGPGGMFSDLDLSMCVVFYVISTGIILGLYHHFIVRRGTMPCKGKCLR